MTRDLGRARTPERPTKIATTPQSPKKSPTSTRPTSSQSGKSPRNPENTFWVYGLQRRNFLDHLNKWSLSHDSSPLFHGTLSICENSQSCQLGKSVNCILTHKVWTDARKRIVIRLFAPQEENGRYRLVVRNGAGWVIAREFFSQEYFNLRRIEARKSRPIARSEIDEILQSRSSLLGPRPEGKDTVTIRPLFHPFLRLPLEIQQLILGIAICKKNVYQPARSPRKPGFSVYVRLTGKLVIVPAPIPLHTAFRISKSVSRHLIPWIYRTTTFHFETTGFTNFLWQSGPTNRPYINKVTLAFGGMAILHCIRWLAPDPIFELFSPPMVTEPPALQYMWRCQIQELAKELHLSILTIDIQNIPTADIPFVVHTLSQCFGSVEKIRITSFGVKVGMDDDRLSGLKSHNTWAGLCKAAFDKYRRDQWFFGARIKKLSVETLHWEMLSQREFFDQTIDEELVRLIEAS
ncbi:hypothetical protein K505DRAFT_236293 [Melanomma pulvis-pyrius CBS 109.77]|uniref:Uncharacterized protein n=1 Tax=Melanomma pulvis-pyrius CBS 109.77 TaxID=1314802 RepID=A0A6A6XMB5_9PLEO|nr:hypothetical protein K505DRAFT_236293 [Melanomma pulvis-pyrius CBS 109.77]